MNGVEPHNHNRFEILRSLSDKNTKKNQKRLRPNDSNPLPENSTNELMRPRYLVASTISSVLNEEVKPLASYNPFQVEKGLNHISEESLEVTKMRSGDLLIKVPNNIVAEKFLRAKLIDFIAVKITLHKTLNTVQGRIKSDRVKDITEEELLEKLKPQNVVGVRKLMKKQGDQLNSTDAAILTFDLHKVANKM